MVPLWVPAPRSVRRPRLSGATQRARRLTRRHCALLPRQDEFLYSFGRGALAAQSGLIDGPPCSDGAATACADSAAEAALFEARANALHNVERVRDWPPRDAGAMQTTQD